MSELLEMIGPEALRNLLQNWPFAAALLAFMWVQIKQLNACYDTVKEVLIRLLEKELQQ